MSLPKLPPGWTWVGRCEVWDSLGCRGTITDRFAFRGGETRRLVSYFDQRLVEGQVCQPRGVGPVTAKMRRNLARLAHEAAEHDGGDE